MIEAGSGGVGAVIGRRALDLDRDRGGRRGVTNDGRTRTAAHRVGWPPFPFEAATAAGRGGVGQLVAVAVAAAVVGSVASWVGPEIFASTTEQTGGCVF